jgi:hypothetical protein
MDVLKVMKEMCEKSAREFNKDNNLLGPFQLFSNLPRRLVRPNFTHAL